MSLPKRSPKHTSLSQLGKIDLQFQKVLEHSVKIFVINLHKYIFTSVIYAGVFHTSRPILIFEGAYQSTAPNT